MDRLPTLGQYFAPISTSLLSEQYGPSSAEVKVNASGLAKMNRALGHLCAHIG